MISCIYINWFYSNGYGIIDMTTVKVLLFHIHIHYKYALRLDIVGTTRVLVVALKTNLHNKHAQV